MRTARATAEGDALGPAGRAWRLLVGRPSASRLERYGIALALAGAAVLAVFVIHGETVGFRVLLYVSVVAVSALRGGVGPGLAALAVCTVGYAVDAPIAWPNEAERPNGLFFVAFSALTVWAAAALREGYRQVHARRRRAEARADSQRIAAELGVRALAEGNLEALLDETLAAVKLALRCDSVTLLELRPDGESLQLRGAAGWGRVHVGRIIGHADAPLAFRSLAAREPLIVDDFGSEPDLAPLAFLERGVTSSLVAPVVALGPAGRPFGVIGAHSRARRQFGSDDVSFLQTAANVIGTAVVRLGAEERVRKTLATERFLAEASRQLALSIEWQQTLGRVVKLALPVLGEWCLLVLVDDAGHPRTVVAEALRSARVAEVEALLTRYPIEIGAAHGVGRIVRTGEPELIPDATPETFVVEHGHGADVRREILQRLGMRSYIGAPLAAGDRILGAIAFGIADGPRRYGPDDLDLLQALAQRCAVALDNARLYQTAQDATRAREQVLAVVSHGLKQPLGALLMGAVMVERLAPPGMEGDALRRSAATVRRTAERMRRLVHDLVDAAALDAGGISIQVASHDPGAIAREAVEAVQDLAADRGVLVSCQGADELPVVPCDRDRVLQALGNLLSNAIQVVPDRGRVLVDVEPGPGDVTFTVADDGPGIPEEELPLVFDRWYRGRDARYRGSGLGLAIARAIVEAHGGRIWARSRAGAGSAFAFTLPSGSAPGSPRAGSGAAADQGDGDPKRSP